MGRLIKVDDVKKIIKLIVASGNVKNKEKPLSLLLIGQVGIGKTELITAFKTKNIACMTDLSMMGLLKELKDNKNIKHIIVPDFIKLTMKRRTTADHLLSLLNAYTEEGLYKFSYPNFQEDFKGRKGGIIIATTKASWGQHKKQWKAIGFVSRMVLCSFSYTKETADKILDYLYQEKYLENNKIKQLKLGKSRNIESTPELNKLLNPLGTNSFRTQKHLQLLIKCNALLEGRDKVTKADLKEIKRLDKYLNDKYKKL